MLVTQPVLIDVRYYMPDYRHILQSFVWQLDDQIPDIPNVHKFLRFWHDNIDAIIQEVVVCSCNKNLKNAAFYKILN